MHCTTHPREGSRSSQHISHTVVQASSFAERRRRRSKCSIYPCYGPAQVFGCAIAAVKSRIASRSCSFCDQSCPVSLCKSDSAARIHITSRSKYIKANPNPVLANKLHVIVVVLTSVSLSVSKSSYWGDCSVVGSSAVADPLGLVRPSFSCANT